MNPNEYFNAIKGMLTFEELLSHGEACDYLSYRGSDLKLKGIPEETRNKIALVYKKMRAKFFYPVGYDFQNKELVWLERTTKNEAHIRWGQRKQREIERENQAPPSLAEMEPQDRPGMEKASEAISKAFQKLQGG